MQRPHDHIAHQPHHDTHHPQAAAGAGLPAAPLAAAAGGAAHRLVPRHGLHGAGVGGGGDGRSGAAAVQGGGRGRGKRAGREGEEPVWVSAEGRTARRLLCGVLGLALGFGAKRAKRRPAGAGVGGGGGCWPSGCRAAGRRRQGSPRRRGGAPYGRRDAIRSAEARRVGPWLAGAAEQQRRQVGKGCLGVLALALGQCAGTLLNTWPASTSTTTTPASPPGLERQRPDARHRGVAGGGPQRLHRGGAAGGGCLGLGLGLGTGPGTGNRGPWPRGRRLGGLA